MQYKYSDSILKVNNLKTYYIAHGKVIRAVDGVTFNVKYGERIGVAGESGSGKTQTMLSVMGINSGVPGIIDGNIILENKDYLDKLPKYCTIEKNHNTLTITKDIYCWKKWHFNSMKRILGSTISMIFQEPKSSLSPFFTIEKQLFDTFKKRNHKPDKSKFIESVNYIFKKLQFNNPEEMLKKYPHQLSGGESQRIMMALSLLCKPKILIADEPTTALDALTRYRIIELFKKVIKDRTMSLIYVTHNLNILKNLVDKIIIMYKGKIVEQGLIKNVMRESNYRVHPYTEFLKSFLSEKTDLSQLFDNVSIQNNKNNNNITGCKYYLRCPLKEKLTQDEKKRCRFVEPPLFKVDTNHYVACWMKGV